MSVHTNIRQGWKCLSVRNTLSYYNNAVLSKDRDICAYIQTLDQGESEAMRNTLAYYTDSVLMQASDTCITYKYQARVKQRETRLFTKLS